MRRDRGFSLAEVMIALALASITSAFLLMITRSQLSAYAQNDALLKAQQNGRAGMDLLETTFRKACGGLAWGRVGVNVPGTPQRIDWCLKLYDGPSVVLTSNLWLSLSAGSRPDAAELVYGTSPFTETTTAVDPIGYTVEVASAAGFAANDVVLLSDGFQGVLLRIRGIALVGAGPRATLTFADPGGTMWLPGDPISGSPAPVMATAAPLLVMHAETPALFVSTVAGATQHTLMYDRDGLLGTGHADAEPLLDGVEDLQLAVGQDLNANGRVEESPDEWLGNNPGVSEFPLLAAIWNQVDNAGLPVGGAPLYRSIRITLTTRTTSQYPGATQIITPIENRTSGFSAATGTTGSYRMRQTQTIVSPRAWNLRAN